MGMVFKNNSGRSKEHKWVASMQGFFKRGEAPFSLVLIRDVNFTRKAYSNNRGLWSNDSRVLVKIISLYLIFKLYNT